jgi:hypothetical protein
MHVNRLRTQRSAFIMPVGIGLLLALLLARPASAQVDFTRAADIFYGDTVNSTLNDERFFDWWRFYAVTGNEFDIDMRAENGLAPLIGILDGGGNLLLRSDDGAVNGDVRVRFTAPREGFYIIVATRVGNENGVTIGDYALSLTWLNPDPTRDPRYQDVTFACGTSEATSVVSLRLLLTADNPAVSLRAYGLDGAQPVIRYRYASDGTTGCAADAPPPGDTLILPGEAPYTLPTPAVSAVGVTLAALTSQPGSAGDELALTIGSLNDLPGRVVVVVAGLALEAAPPLDERGVPIPADADVIEVRAAPRAAAAPDGVLLYMVGASDARLDPFIRLLDAETGCDDAGRRAPDGRGCETITPFVNAGVALADGARYLGDRFDAGALIAPGDSDPHVYELTTFNRSTYGGYALLVIAALTPRA